jgi:putative ABC transport system substrate-binding protein
MKASSRLAKPTNLFSARSRNWGHVMNRRSFIGTLTGGLLATPLAGGAQQVQKIPEPLTGAAVLVEAFRQGMRELGYVEGKTFVLEARYGQGNSETLPQLARELVGREVDVIVAATDGPIAVVKRETRTIPIVMTNSADPVGTGFVASLARPGGNVTGLSTRSADLSGKRLELLREVVPGLSRVAFLWNPRRPGHRTRLQRIGGGGHFAPS